MYSKVRVMERFRFCLCCEGKCGIEVNYYDEAGMMPMVTVKGQVQETWLWLELLVWAVVQKG